MICMPSLAILARGCVSPVHKRQPAKSRRGSRNLGPIFWLCKCNSRTRRHDFHYLKKPGDVDVQEHRNPTEDDQHEADRGWQQRSCHSYVLSSYASVIFVADQKFERNVSTTHNSQVCQSAESLNFNPPTGTGPCAESGARQKANME